MRIVEDYMGTSWGKFRVVGAWTARNNAPLWRRMACDELDAFKARVRDAGGGWVAER